ncbi:hypothetical protein MMYC01_201140 [Madurella mycetomatis]|uniref:Uncharacterized protein n=1 Tax=Madurella mycetomatis TaxID=100816 RepID=A0A175WFX4_9PEZI|nr:hypothetical protein MMYC01_201140 [Madurella mycetomatis]
MDYWLRKGRPALIAALEEACGTVEEDLAAEIRERDRDRHASLLDEISQLKAAAGRAGRLEQENRSLVRELEELRTKYRDVPRDAKTAHPAQHVPQATRPALAEIFANSKTGALGPSASEASLENSSLEKRYSRLARQYAALAERWEQTHSAARKYRDSQDAWVKYADWLEAKVKRLEKKLQHVGDACDQLPTATSTASKAAKLRPTEISNYDTVSGILLDPESTSGLGLHENTVAGPTGHGEASSTPIEAGANGQSASADEEALEGISEACKLPPIPPFMDTTSAMMIKEEPSSDDPIIVSERTVRKRKHPDDEPEGSAPSPRIKSENPSSDPVVTGEAVAFSPHESIDLDGEQDVMPTPRKQRRPVHQRYSDDEAVLSRVDEAPLDPHPAETRAGNSFFNTPAPALGNHKSRSPRSGLPVHRSVRTHADRKIFISAAWTLDGAISDVAEGTFESFSSPRPQQGRNPPTHLPPARGRLHSLLNPSPSEQETSGLRPAQNNRDDLMSSAVTSPAVKANQSISVLRRGQDMATPPRASRLRDRPVAELRVEDFKD